MPDRRKRIVVKEAEPDLAEMARAWKIPEKLLVKTMRNGSNASTFTEVWAAQIEGMEKCVNSNQRDYDAVGLPGMPDDKVSIRCLTRYGIKFQSSRYIGSGRSSDETSVETSLLAADHVAVVDIRAFPFMRFAVVRSCDLRTEAAAGQLGRNGWKAKRFYDFLNCYYVYKTLRVDLFGNPA